MFRDLPTMLAAAAVFAASTAAIAQDAATDAEIPSGAPPEPYVATWTDSEIQMIAERLSGTWFSQSGVEAMGDAASSQVVMSIAPVHIEGMDNTLFIEAAQSDSLDRPYRFAIFELFRYKGGVRLRTHEIATVLDSRRMLAGLSLAPSWFPDIPADELIPTADLDLTVSSGTISGASAHPFPTRLGGAVEMTSEFTLTGDTWETGDRGFDAQGNLVWGAAQGDSVTFERGESPVKVTTFDSGTVVIEYANPGRPVSNGDRLHVHYTGWQKDRTSFDSSRGRNRPFVFAFPPGARAIPGWGTGMEGVSLGAKRKLLIPGQQAYAERGNPRSSIGPNEPLYFEIEIAHIDYMNEDGQAAGSADQENPVNAED